MAKYLLSWTAPEGQTAKAELDGLVVDGNEAMVCNTWWGASLLAAKIAFDNESLTQRVTEAAELIDEQSPQGDVTVNGWTFTISDVHYSA
jgi:hypothetical protein